MFSQIPLATTAAARLAVPRSERKLVGRALHVIEGSAAQGRRSKAATQVWQCLNPRREGRVVVASALADQDGQPGDFAQRPFAGKRPNSNVADGVVSFVPKTGTMRQRIALWNGAQVIRSSESRVGSGRGRVLLEW